MGNKNAGIEAIKRLREKREAEKTNVEVEGSDKKEVNSYMLHDDSLYRVNLLNHLFEISQSLKKLTVLLGGEEREE